MKTPKFSVIIPAHNEEDVIERAIKSILNQTYQNFEIIISNDGSTDKTKEIVENLIKKDKRIKILNQDKGHSAAFARNWGAEKAKGEILIFLDADTFISTNALEEISKSILDVDAFAFDCIPKNKTIVNYALSGLVVPIVARKQIYSKEDKDQIMFFCISQNAFNKLKGYDETIFYFEDEDLVQRFYEMGFKTINFNTTMQYYELPATFKGFLRQCKWIAKGLNSIKIKKQRMKTKLFWLIKSIFLVMPLLFSFSSKLFFISLGLTLGFTYILLIKRNKNIIKSLVALPFLYIKTGIITYLLIKNL
jgi:glycosyltransferase involved in cell wall biosynthesis